MAGYWTDHEKNLLREYISQGLSASLIARNIPGKTRNSVIGFVHRSKGEFKLVGGTQVVRDARLAKPPKGINLLSKQNSIPTSLAPRTRAIKNRIMAAEAKAKSVPTFSNAPFNPKNKTIFELKHFDCRAVINEPNGIETVYCGDIVVPGKSWCQHHFNLYTVPRQTRDKAN